MLKPFNIKNKAVTAAIVSAAFFFAIISSFSVLYLLSGNEISQYKPGSQNPVALTVNAVNNAPEVLDSVSQKITYTTGAIDQNIITGTPVRIRIPSVNVDLPIEPGYYDYSKHTWTVGDRKAYYATLSSQPSNKPGNTLIYAHNRKDAFRNVHSMKAGEIVEVFMADGKIFVYRAFEIETVQPTDTELFTYSDVPRLTLLTCEGRFSEVRKLVYGTLIEIR